MVKIINPFSGQSPIAAAFDNIGQGAYRQAMMREAQAKAWAAERQNAELGNLAGMARTGGGFQALQANPDAQAEALLAGVDPHTFGGYGLIGAANQYGAEDPRTANAQVGAGESFDATAPAFNRKLGQERDLTMRGQDITRQDVLQQSADRNRIADQNLAWEKDKFGIEPQAVMQGGAPAFVPRSQETQPGITPILSEGQGKGNLLMSTPMTDAEKLRAVGAEPLTPPQPENYVTRGPDGRQQVILTVGGKDLQGNPLPPGGFIEGTQGAAGTMGLTNNVVGDVQQKLIQIDQAKRALAATRAAVDASPEQNFGLAGTVKGFAQDATQVVNNLSLGMGFHSPQEAVNYMAQTLQAQGVSSGVVHDLFKYDPRLESIKTLYGMLVYQMAASSGQFGKGLSDNDTRAFAHLVGDPENWAASKQSLQAKLQQLQANLDSEQQGYSNVMANGGVPTAAPAAPGGGAVEKWDYVNGKLQRVQ